MELRRRGAQVLRAGSTDETIHQAALVSPDILIMDDDLNQEGPTSLGAFIHDAFPNAGIILLHGSGQPTSSPSGLDLLLWAHKRVADQTLIETIEMAFPGRLGRASPVWPRPRRIVCIDAEPPHLKSLSWMIAMKDYEVSQAGARSGKAPVTRGIGHPQVPESGDGGTGRAPRDITGVHGE